MSRLKAGREKGAMFCRWRKVRKSTSVPDGRDLRNAMWRQKGPPEPPEPRLRLKQERSVDKPSLRGSDGAFSRPPSSPRLPP